MRVLAWQGVDYPFCSLWYFQSSTREHAAVVRAVKASSLAVVRSTFETLAAVGICVTVALSQTTNLILRTTRVSSGAALDSWHRDVGGGNKILTCTIVHLPDFLVKVAVGHSQIAMAKVGLPVRSTNRIIVVRAGFRAFFNTAMSKAAGRLDTFVICGLTNLSLDASLIAVRVATEVLALPIMQQLDFAARGAGCIFLFTFVGVCFPIRATDRLVFPGAKTGTVSLATIVSGVKAGVPCPVAVVFSTFEITFTIAIVVTIALSSSTGGTIGTATVSTYAGSLRQIFISGSQLKLSPQNCQCYDE